MDLYALLGTNVEIQHNIALDAEFANLLQDMSLEQKELCLRVCRTNRYLLLGILLAAFFHREKVEYDA